jgi:hypothetical protein
MKNWNNLPLHSIGVNMQNSRQNKVLFFNVAIFSSLRYAVAFGILMLFMVMNAECMNESVDLIVSGAGPAKSRSEILEQYPNGWANVEDVECFGSDLDLSFTVGPEDEDPAVDPNREQIIDIVFQRTKARLETKNINLLLSCLYLGSIAHSGDFFPESNWISDKFKVLLNDFLKDYAGAGNSNEFIGKSIWQIQCEAIRKSKEEGRQGANFSLLLLEKCFFLLLPKHKDFIRNVVVPEMIKCGFKKAIPAEWALY